MVKSVGLCQTGERPSIAGRARPKGNSANHADGNSPGLTNDEGCSFISENVAPDLVSGVWSFYIWWRGACAPDLVSGVWHALLIV